MLLMFKAITQNLDLHQLIILTEDSVELSVAPSLSVVNSVPERRKT
jgi:hypothetical protein